MNSFRPHIRHGSIELLLMRCAFAAMIGHTFLEREFFAGQPYPNGIAQFVDLTALANPGIDTAVRLSMLALLAVYALGYALPFVTTALFGLTVWIGTLSNSQGAISHGDQIVPLVLLGQMLAYWRPALSRVLRGRFAPPSVVSIDDLAVHYAQQMIAAVYVTAGITKLIRSRGRWILDVPDIAVEIVKTHSQRFYNSLEAGLIERGEQIAEMVLAYPNVARLLLSGGLFLELGAFLALRGRVNALAVGVALISMHLGIEWLMMLHFRTNQFVVLIFLVNLPFWVGHIASRRWRP